MEEQMSTELDLIGSTINTNIASLLKSRTDFQLEKFVVNQHDTDEMRFKQCLLEMHSIYYPLKTLYLEVKKLEIQINNLLKSENELDQIDAEIKQLNLDQINFSIIGSLQELNKLKEIYDSFEHKYTSEEIENNQAEYWDKRLRRQSILAEIGGSPGQASHLDSLRQIGAIVVNTEKATIESSAIIENKKSEIE
jgi:hypothetical protein